ncbi:hypothetical protein [Campylobacter troglodytis]|nr:hypothetical protein [Campylobacter troglodytis]
MNFFSIKTPSLAEGVGGGYQGVSLESGDKKCLPQKQSVLLAVASV